MHESRIRAVDHVHIDGQQASVEQIRWFYEEVLLLDEIVRSDRPSDLLCFRSERIELRIRLMENPNIDGVAVRVTIAVDSLEQVEEMLHDQKMLVEKISGLKWTDIRLHTLDPSGNRVELINRSHWGPF